MRLAMLVLGLFLAVPGTAHASQGNMTVADFLARAYVLKARGFTALFSEDYRLLKREAAAAANAYTIRLASERTAGRPSSCPPRSVKVNSDLVIGYLETYPHSVRGRTSLVQAVTDYYQRNWPCTGGTQLARFPR